MRGIKGANMYIHYLEKTIRVFYEIVLFILKTINLSQMQPIDELIDCFKNKNNFKEEEYKPNLDLLNAYIKNKTSKFVFDKNWEILIKDIWMN